MNRLSLNSIITPLAIAFLSVSFILPGKLWTLLLIALLFIASVILRAVNTIHVTIFCFLLVLLPMISPVMALWPLTLFAPLVIYHLIVFLVPPLRRSYDWLRFGRISKGIFILMLITVFVSTLALIGWYRFMKPDLNIYLGWIQDMPLALITFAGLGFALLNSVIEEFSFRGIIMDGMDSAFNIPVVSIIFQAGAFGMMHYVAGFPKGIIGVLMTFIYGILLGIICNRSKGMMSPVVTHFFADLTIFIILVTLLL